MRASKTKGKGRPTHRSVGHHAPLSSQRNNNGGCNLIILVSIFRPRQAEHLFAFFALWKGATICNLRAMWSEWDGDGRCDGSSVIAKAIAKRHLLAGGQVCRWAARTHAASQRQYFGGDVARVLRPLFFSLCLSPSLFCLSLSFSSLSHHIVLSPAPSLLLLLLFTSFASSLPFLSLYQIHPSSPSFAPIFH